MKPTVATVAALPETDVAALRNYELSTRAEILALLRALRDKRALVTAYVGQGLEFLVTSVISVRPEFEELTFGLGRDASLNRRLLSAKSIVFVATLDQVKLQFSAERAELIEADGESAFRVRIPDVLLRLQRRNFFRVHAPLARPLVCRAPSPSRTGEFVDLTVLDISCGGFGVWVDPGRLDAYPGLVLENCTLDLPEVATLELTVEVRHVSDIRRVGRPRKRLGCRFLNADGPTNTLLQRYVNRAERESLIPG